MLTFILKIVVGISAVYVFAYPMVHITGQIFNHLNTVLGSIRIP